MLVLPSGRSGRSPPQLLLVLDPGVRVVVGRVNQFRNYLQVRLYYQNGPCVLVFTAVVRRRKDRYQGSSCEPFEPIHNALVSPYYHAQVVLLEALLSPIRPELHDVP